MSRGRFRLLDTLKACDASSLGSRELELLVVLVAYGEAYPGDSPSNTLIAEMFGISRSAVGRHRKSLQKNLGLPPGL